ncbi:hypothetical protein [Brevibacterium epidermidis]|uniref:hypothetical protein n=1 Tax=Brevibacterium epidermidis TaxID=1698 RepID=UPI0007856BD3|nr:hypothetical protein [Brevibacterium epidermidis]
MKKIILAPAVALAFTGLVASPVVAAESTSAQSASTQTAKQKKVDAEKAAADKKKEEAKKAAAEKAEAEKKAAAEKAAADKKAKEKAEAAKKAAADKKKADEKKAAEDKKDDAKKPPKKVDPKPAPAPKDEDKDAKDDDKSEDKANPINASVQVTSGEVTAEELAEEGVTVKVTGLEKGDKVSAKSGLTGPAVTAQGSTATMKLHSANEVKQKRVNFALQLERPGTQSVTETSVVPLADESEAPEVDPTVSLSTDEISQSGIEDDGIKVTGEGFTPNGTVNVVGGAEQSPFATQEVTANADGEITATLKYEAEKKLPAGDYAVWGVDQGSNTNSPAQDFTVTEDPVIDPTVKVASKTISLEDFKKDGLKFSGTGFSPDGTVSVKADAVSQQSAAAPQDAPARADEDGNVEGVVKAPASFEAGTYSLTFIDDVTSAASNSVEVTVTEDDEDAVDPIDASLKVDPKEITAEDLANKDKGVTVTVSGVKKGDKITDSLTGETETAEADGDYELNLWYEGNPDNLEVGKVPFTVTIDREGTESETLEGNINVVAEDGDDDGDDGNEDGNDDGKDGSDDGDDGETEAPADASFTVSPKKIEAADFANENKGVTLAVENCEPGADVHFEVNPKGINVTAYENTVTADDEGNASVNVFGTSSDVSAYVGAYTATATCGDDTMKDSFTVTGGANGGGSDGGDNGNAGNGGDDGSQLPRTGADLGGLTTGALLLLVGGAAIALTGRKNKFGQTPTSF